jgi:predicted ABC-type transport system involved in lysophospholipase L1 biosynthesis ATPase subunit
MNAYESLSRVGPVLRTRGLEKEYGQGKGLVRALDGVELEVDSGETLAVMGPSGCGKSTLLHLLGGLERPSAGEVWLDGRRIDQLSEKALARLRRRAIAWGSETLSPAADSVHQLDPPQARFRSATYGLTRRDLLGSEADEWSAFDVDRADRT